MPRSDVLVAQSGPNVAVWYNVDAPDPPVFVPVRGECVGVAREQSAGSRRKRTVVQVDEPGPEADECVLDEDLIDFGTLLHDGDFGQAVLFLEDRGEQPQTEAMWENVANNAMADRFVMMCI